VREPVTEYEILLLLDPELSDEGQTDVVNRVRGLVEKGGGTWVHYEPWGRRKLAYEIDHKGEGHYHLLHVDCAPETLDEVARVLKIDDGVMRNLSTRRLQTAPEVTVAVASPVSDDVVAEPASASEEE
jgi:small subunit ribosomal protein S6